MLNFKKIVEIFISLEIIIISTFIPASLSLPFTNKLIQTFEFPISLQLPSIIIITFIFNGEIVVKAYSIYLFIGLFFLPVFHNGGSLGYLLTPYFGYILGIYPLINIINKLNKNISKINYYDLLKYGFIAICSMHIIGIFYICIQLLYFKKTDLLLYNISKYSLGKIGYHLLMLIPTALIVKLINNYKYKK